MHAAVIDGNRRVTLVTGGWDDLHPCAVVPVTGVAGHDRTISRCFLSDHDACTTFGGIDRPGIFDFLALEVTTVTYQSDCKEKKSIHEFCYFVQRLKI